MFDKIVAFDFTVDGEDCPDILYARIQHKETITPVQFRNDVEIAQKQFNEERDNGMLEDEELFNILSENFGYECEVICPDFEIKI